MSPRFIEDAIAGAFLRNEKFVHSAPRVQPLNCIEVGNCLGSFSWLMTTMLQGHGHEMEISAFHLQNPRALAQGHETAFCIADFFKTFQDITIAPSWLNFNNTSSPGSHLSSTSRYLR
jgi:hypothetical protein